MGEVDKNKLASFRNAIEQVLEPYTAIRYANGEIQNEAVFDRRRDRYLIVSVGWQGVRRVQHCLIHVDIIDGKAWIQRDGTEDGIAPELEAAGIPRSDIVLAFHSSEDRPYTGYAVA